MNKLDGAREKINRIDKEMAELWTKRMEAVREVSEYKRENGLSVLDSSRESELLSRNLGYVPEELRGCYSEFFGGTLSSSKRYQRELEAKPDGSLRMELGDRSYDIVIRRGSLSEAGKYMKLDRKVLVVTDDGVPAVYAKTVAAQCLSAEVVTLPQGEKTKCLESFRLLLKAMLERGFTRKDCVVAVGGGVIGDLAGFAASAYMRGVDFYNIPTTTLSQIDSSIGGKVAIDLDGYKNTVGAFWQPKLVLIDPDTLSTLDRRQYASGLAEAVKMSLTSDAELFEMFESGDTDSRLGEIIRRSLMIKKRVVEQDERESGLRKILNFGHTVGHGIETAENGRLMHGECVALGMLPMCSESLRERLRAVLKSLGLPTEITAPIEKIKEAMLHDKKSDEGGVTVVRVDEAGSFRLEKIAFNELFRQLEEYLTEVRK